MLTIKEKRKVSYAYIVTVINILKALYNTVDMNSKIIVSINAESSAVNPIMYNIRDVVGRDF